jgi:hypothetical protein
VLVNQQTLQWYHDKSPDTYRGFCNHCGASLFWDPRDDQDKVAVSAGSLDDSGELKTIGHVYVSEAGKYYQINDELPSFETGNAGALESDESG